MRVWEKVKGMEEHLDKVREISDRHLSEVVVLEAKVKRLEEMLARVKSESLRVVVAGEECEITGIGVGGCFAYQGVVYRLEPYSEVEFWARQLTDESEHLFAPHAWVLPVRLVTWGVVGSTAEGPGSSTEEGEGDARKGAESQRGEVG